MHLAAADQFHAFKVPRTQIQIAVAVVRHFHQHRAFIDFQRIERFAKRLRLRFFHIERIHHDQLAV